MSNNSSSVRRMVKRTMDQMVGLQAVQETILPDSLSDAGQPQTSSAGTPSESTSGKSACTATRSGTSETSSNLLDFSSRKGVGSLGVGRKVDLQTAERNAAAKHAQSLINQRTRAAVAMLSFRQVLPQLVRTDCQECRACEQDPPCIWKMGALLEGHRPDEMGFYVRPSTTEPRNPNAWEARCTTAAPFPLQSPHFRMVLQLMPPGATVDCYSGLATEQDSVQRVSVQEAGPEILIPPGMVLRD